MVVLWKLLLLVLLRNEIVIKSQQACSSIEYYTVQGLHRTSQTTYIAYRTRTTLKCCSGYSGIYPDCEKICDPGYVLKNGDCEPICNDGCSAGSCFKPNRCEDCDFGFELYEGDCEPACSMRCDNGFCSAPDKCSCNSGYKMNDFNICEAVCDEGCYNGICVGPNKCECYNGFELRNKDCHPQCAVLCENGFCSSPYQCECLEGYTMNSKNYCAPVCSDGCIKDHCYTPNDCQRCQQGYHLQIDEEKKRYCKPSCDNCNNGNCISPGVCELSSPITLKEASTDPSSIETENDEFFAEYSTLKFFKEEEDLEIQELLDIIRLAKPTSTPEWVPWMIVVVAAILIVTLAVVKSLLILNKRYKARFY